MWFWNILRIHISISSRIYYFAFAKIFWFSWVGLESFYDRHYASKALAHRPWTDVLWSLSLLVRKRRERERERERKRKRKKDSTSQFDRKRDVRETNYSVCRRSTHTIPRPIIAHGQCSPRSSSTNLNRVSHSHLS